MTIEMSNEIKDEAARIRDLQNQRGDAEARLQLADTVVKLRAQLAEQRKEIEGSKKERDDPMTVYAECKELKETLRQVVQAHGTRGIELEAQRKEIEELRKQVDELNATLRRTAKSV